MTARVVYHALGGGHGHVLRGLAILGRLGHGTLVGPARLRAWAEAAGIAYVSPREGNAAAWVAAQPPPDLLLADVFPRGVTGELAPWLGRVPAWLVTRRVVPDYYLHPEVKHALESSFERIVWTEAPHPALRALAVVQHDVAPVLLAVDALSRDEARRRLGVADDRPLVLGLGSGEPARQARLCRLLSAVAARAGAALRFISDALPPAHPVVRLFPAAGAFAAADVVVSAAGYHAFHETAAAGVPTVFVPQNRRYDDQWWRARDALVAGDPAALEAAVVRLLRQGRRRPRRLEDVAGGVARAVERRMQAGVLAEEQIAPVA